VTIEGLRITGGDAAGLAGKGGPHDSGGGVYGSDAIITLSDNLVFSNTAYYGGGMHLRFAVSTLSHDIDAGVDAGVVTDIDGESRPMGIAYDIGADEFEAPELPNKTYIPVVVREE
jgi:hypothetical protein